MLRYDAWCRRMDLKFRARYPHLNTKIFEIDDSHYEIFVVEDVGNFSDIAQIFDRGIRYLTAPVKLVNSEPSMYQCQLQSIPDTNIPYNFEGIAVTLNDIYNHLASIHRNVKISQINEDHNQRTINVKVVGKLSPLLSRELRETLHQLGLPYAFMVDDGWYETAESNSRTGSDVIPQDEVLNILSSRSRSDLNCPFLERDEELWFDNINQIYDGSVSKSDLYFIESDKTSCFVDFSVFPNINLRNHILLYDIVYCALPLADRMSEFFAIQKLDENDVLALIERGRLKVVNLQPESRLDYGFLNEIFQTNSLSVISRRALSVLCAVNLVEINRSYVFSDTDLQPNLFQVVRDIAELIHKDENLVANYLLWPRRALRDSLDILNRTGPMGIPAFGVNQTINDSLKHIQMPQKDRGALQFEFDMHSTNIHLAHALDATYFPFVSPKEKYSDHPYTSMMGNLLDAYKLLTLENITDTNKRNPLITGNPSLNMVSIFEMNEYLPILEFEECVSSVVIRGEVRSLLSELSQLPETQRNQRIEQYNMEIEKLVRSKGVRKCLLDLGIIFMSGRSIPLLVLLLPSLLRSGKRKYAGVEALFEWMESKRMSLLDKVDSTREMRKVSVLSQINRVARLRKT